MILAKAALLATGGRGGYPAPRLAVMTAVGLAIFCASAGRRAPAEVRGFEVASIRPSDPDSMGHRVQMGPILFDARASVRDLMKIAYNLQAYQIIGGPEWIDSQRYDIRAKAGSPSSPDQIRAMLVDLLKERFRLRVHTTSQSMAVYALTVSRTGPKLRTSKEGTPRDGVGAIQKASWGVVGHGSTMALFAGFLTLELDRPVLDSTGLSGGYDFELTYSDVSATESSEDTFGSIFSALHDVGLKLESRKADVPVLIVDGAERPSAN